MSINLASGIHLIPNGEISRLEIRPQNLRQPEYQDLYDYYTLIYDSFISGSELIIVGPPLLNLEDQLFPLEIFFFEHPIEYQYFSLDRCYSIHINLEKNSQDIIEKKLTIKDQYCHLFEENYLQIYPESHQFDQKRVLCTLQKNNPIEWILFWAKFYIKIHKTDAILIYDNGSDLYSLDALEQALTSLEGLTELTLIKWPYPFGPGAWSPKGEPPSYWDSDFCQLGAIEDAKKRFLKNAKSAIFVDIDELIVPTQSECSCVHEFTENSTFESILIEGEWVSNAVTSESLNRHQWDHGDFSYLFSERKPASAKYCVNPSRSPIDSQWKVHRGGKKYMKQDQFALRHFQSISTNWKCKRPAPCPIDVHQHQKDIHLERCFQQLKTDPILFL